jgi:hypothetical protein
MAPKKKVRTESPAVGPAWQFQEDDGSWMFFNDADSSIIEQHCTAKTPQFTSSTMSFADAGVSIEYNLAAGTQTNKTTNVVRKIRRVTRGVWEYIDDHGMYVQFYDDDNDVIEAAWRKLAKGEGQFQTTALSWNKGYDSKYTFVFARDPITGSVTATQTNEDSGNKRQLRRSEPDQAGVVWDTKGYGISSMAAPTVADVAVSGPPAASCSSSSGAVFVAANVFAPPVTWQPQEKSLQFFDVAAGSAEYDSVIKPFLSTLKSKATIHSLTRLQNETLWKFYALTRHRIAVRNKGDPDEKLLYHGARVRENMNSIMEFGFDMRVARDGSAGVGIYFAVNASYSNAGYVLQNPDKSKEMFLCRVAIGSCVQGKHGLKRPPPKSNKKADKDDLHDSVHNNVNVMFIVFDNCQAYPEYLIKYTPSTGW